MQRFRFSTRNVSVQKMSKFWGGDVAAFTQTRANAKAGAVRRMLSVLGGLPVYDLAARDWYVFQHLADAIRCARVGFDEDFDQI